MKNLDAILREEAERQVAKLKLVTPPSVASTPVGVFKSRRVARPRCGACGSQPTFVQANDARLRATVVVCGRPVAIEPLRHAADNVYAPIAVAYEPWSRTLEVICRGTFTLHRYQYAAVPEALYDRLRASHNPTRVLKRDIEPHHEERYVQRRAWQNHEAP